MTESEFRQSLKTNNLRHLGHLTLEQIKWASATFPYFSGEQRMFLESVPRREPAVHVTHVGRGAFRAMLDALEAE